MDVAVEYWSLITNIRCVCRGELSKSKQHAADLDKQLADAKATIEKCLKDYDTLLAKTQKVVTYTVSGYRIVT